MQYYQTSSGEFWIARQPVLVALYLEKFLPTHLMDRYVYGKFGPKRVALWRNRYDLYDPSSWSKQKSNNNNNQNE
jgi:hypothetical protein